MLKCILNSIEMCIEQYISAVFCCSVTSWPNANGLLEGPLQGIHHEAFHQAGLGSGPHLENLGIVGHSNLNHLRQKNNNIMQQT